MWNEAGTNVVLTDRELSDVLLQMKSGIAVVETGTRGTSKHVVCCMQREAKESVTLTANHICQELCRGIKQPEGDPRRYIRELLTAHQKNVIIITEDIYYKEATQQEFGHAMRELSDRYAMIFVCKEVRFLTWMLSEFENQGRLFCWTD